MEKNDSYGRSSQSWRVVFRDTADDTLWEMPYFIPKKHEEGWKPEEEEWKAKQVYKDYRIVPDYRSIRADDRNHFPNPFDFEVGTEMEHLIERVQDPEVPLQAKDGHGQYVLAPALLRKALEMSWRNSGVHVRCIFGSTQDYSALQNVMPLDLPKGLHGNYTDELLWRSHRSGGDDRKTKIFIRKDFPKGEAWILGKTWSGWVKQRLVTFRKKLQQRVNPNVLDMKISELLSLGLKPDEIDNMTVAELQAAIHRSLREGNLLSDE